MKYHSKWAADASKRYPLLFSVTRPVTSDNIKNSNAVAIDNYLRCELLTCSEETLESFLNDTEKAWKDNQNLSMDILRNSAKRYGFDSLNDIEERLASRINTKDI
jgi:transaldolase